MFKRHRSPHLLHIRSDSTICPAVGALPVFSWEMSQAVWTFANGFKQSPVIAGSVPAAVVAA
jgi:hypothetical protein